MTRTEPAPTRRRTGGRRALSVAVAVVLLAVAVVVWVILGRREPASSGGSAAATTTTEAAAPASDSAGPTSAPAGGGPTTDELMTPADLAGIGLTVSAPEAAAEPALPPLCGNTTWSAEWSAPGSSVGQRYPATGAGISEHLMAYTTPAAATAALAQLVQDAVACPSPAQGGGIASAGTADGLAGSAVFMLNSPGTDGVTAIEWIVVTPRGNTLVETGYATDQSIGTGSGPGDGGDDATGDSNQARATGESIARLAADRVPADG